MPTEWGGGGDVRERRKELTCRLPALIWKWQRGDKNNNNNQREGG